MEKDRRTSKDERAPSVARLDPAAKSGAEPLASARLFMLKLFYGITAER